MSRLLGGRIWKTLAQPIHDLLQRGAGSEDLLHAALLERGDVVVRDDAAAEDDDVRRLPPLQLFDHSREERHVRTRMDGEADHLGVLLERCLEHHLGSLAEPGVNHLVTRVAQGPGDHLHTPVMAVQPNLGDHDPDWAHGGRRHQTTAVSVYVPKTSIMACMISPSVAYARTASRMYGIRLSVPAAALRNPLSALLHSAWSRLRRTCRTRSDCSLSRRGSIRRMSIGGSSSTVNSLTPTTRRRFCSSSCW